MVFGKISKKSFGIPIFLHRESNNRYNLQPQSSVRILHTCFRGKRIAIYPDYVLSYYDNSGKEWLENIEKYYEKFPYKACKYLIIDKSNLITVCEHINGESKIDDEHAVLTAKYIIEKQACCNSIENKKYANDIGIEEVLFCVQHGDAAASNILWEDEQQICFIDLDEIGVYPLLYDLFRLLLKDYKKKGFYWYINDTFDDELRLLCNKCGVSFDDSFKDKYLAVFMHMYKNDKDWDISFIKKDMLPTNYEYSSKVCAS